MNWKFEYDDADRITSIINPGGKQTKIRYELNEKSNVRRIRKEFSDASEVIFDFDRFGRRVRMTDDHGTVRYEYDGFNHLTGVYRDGGPSISYTYDTMDRISSISLGDGLTIAYTFDFLGRLARMDTPDGAISYEYQTGQGMVIRTLPNGIRTIWEYYPDGTLKSISHVAKDNRILSQFTYFYRPDGLISQVREVNTQGQRKLDYEYDKIQRLVTATNSLGSKTTFHYDKLGNRIQSLVDGQQLVTSAYDWAGRMVHHNGHDCAHDAAGNLTSYVSESGKSTFEYNEDNLLKTACTDRGKVTYEYDGDGNLLQRTVNGNKTSFIPDPLTDIWRPLLATDSNGKQTFYIWEEKTPLATISGEEVMFFLHDHLGSVRCVSNREGKIVHRQDYSPFGVAQQGNANAAVLPGFSGLFLDPVAKQYMTRGRAYNPVLGRFMQLDPQHRTPFGSQKDLSMYNYCGNDPVNFIDLNGADRQRSQYLTSHTEYGVEALKRFGEEFLGPSPLTGMPPCLVPTLWGAPIDLVDTFGKASATANLYLAANAYIFRTSGTSAHWIPGIVHMSSSIISGIKAHAPGGTLTTVFTPASIPTPPPPMTSIATATPTTTAIATPTATPRHIVPSLTPTPTVTPMFGATPTVSPTPTPYAGRLAPSSVGGIYLRGAGDVLKDLGPLKGIAIDENNGRLVLLSEEKGEIELPPLRMDDVVTIFRSVYEHGDAPYVSIDPDPRDPQGPMMLVRHGEGTEGTYVGWVLFEADRVMKAYSLGYDNITRKKVESQIEGYQNIIDLGFSGFSGHQKKPIWERFWIVPAEVNRRQTTDKRLTLFDVPLKVNTQKMELRKGKLVPAADVTPSKAAQKFAEWFTNHYDDLSKEAFSKPPEDSDVDSPVSFFGELRRIALMTSITETLRDQGVPFPLWMKDYPVKPCTITPATPSITVKASKTKRSEKGETIQQQSVTGGVSLSASDKDIHTQKGAREAEELAPEVLERIAAVPVLCPVVFEKDGKRYQAVALPGNNTRDVGANTLNQVDLDVLVQRGTRIVLKRKFHSFFKPSGVLGSGWTLDLPRLEKWRRPKKRTGEEVTYKTVYQLSSSLNTWNESFSEYEFVKEVNAKILAPATSGNMLGIVGFDDERIGHPTHAVLFRDGRQWHFDDNGNLVARLEAPLMVIYHRDGAHRIRRIEGWYGDKLRGDIRLEYDTQGRVISATGSNESVVQYKYDKENLLTRTENSKGVVTYEYKNGLVTCVSRNGKVESHFEYTPRGQLKREQRADGTQITYALNSRQDGVQISALLTQLQGKKVSTEYDAKFRPVRRVMGDGTDFQWQYLDSGATEITINTPEGDQYHVTHSADHKKTSIQFPEGGTYQVEYDSAGRMVSLKKGNLQALRQQWHQNGQLAKQQYESVALIPEYRKDEVLTGLLVTPPGDNKQFSHWFHIDYDELGRPVKETDYSGGETKIGYDAGENLGVVVSRRGGVKITRNSKGKVEKVETSWGYGQLNTYDPNNGELKKVELTSGNKKALIEFNNEKPRRVKHFDGAELHILYYNQGAVRGQIKEVRTPNNLVLHYEYDSDNRPKAVSCGSVCKLEYTYDAKGRLSGLAQIPVGRH